MVEARRVTIGGTINLENFENFRYEIEGVITTIDDYLSLAGFTAGCLLAQAAKADPFVRERIQKHLVRTFGIREEDLPDAPRQEGIPETPTEAPAAAEPAPVQQTPKPEKAPAPVPEAKASTSAKPPIEKKAEPVSPAMPVATAPKKAAVEKPAAGTCAECGADLTEAQVKMSQLFMSKSLCKPCMDKSQGVPV